MSLGSGMAIGISVGIGSGMAMGIPAGKRKAREEISDYLERNRYSLVDRQGKPVSIEECLIEATGCGDSGATRAGLWVTLGLGILVLAAGVLYFYMRS